ncbi:MAG TPA: TraB/GumN family protein, partial [Caulobacteraceae bacterium]|nr:TraB/GumN family protein [Caulobacteraceae bacterium]
LQPSEAWRSPAVDHAFREANELWLEVPLPVTAKGSTSTFSPEGGQALAQIINTLGTTTDGPPLTSRLTPAEAAELVALVPVPQQRLDHMRPWLAAALVQTSYMQKLGLSVTSGADYTLDQEAVAGGKPVKSFETVEQQAHFFADAAPAEQLDFLRQALDDAAQGAPRFEAMERAWLAGDNQALDRLLLQRAKAAAPWFYQRLVVDRNRRWIPQIETMLKTPGVRFVAVGGGHLLGPDGVPALLRMDGWRVERVGPARTGQ